MNRAQICALLGVTALALGSVLLPTSSLAQKKKTAALALPDWRGVWSGGDGSKGGGPEDVSRNIDPTTKSGAFQPNAPLNPEQAAIYKQSLSARVQGKPINDIGCLPEGPPRIMRAPYPMEVVITPGEVWILQEFKHEVRRIYTDGRKPAEDVDPSYEGYSTGHWEGDTLVFDTVALKAGTLDSGGLLHSDALTLHERMRRVSPKLLEDQITMTDPKVLTKPWTVTRVYHLEKRWEMKEFDCEENDRNPINANGQTGVSLKK
jgi:hypothetical protein